MKKDPNHASQVDDLQFDRLVDGELGEEKRRELLAGLDNEPGGWRRCALAFLESQCWRETLRAPKAEATADGTRSVPATRDGTRRAPATTGTRHVASAMRTVLAMAASFLLAMGLVSWVQRARIGGPLSTDVASTFRAPPTGSQLANSTNFRQAPVQVDNPGMPHASIRQANPWQLVTVSNGQQPGESFNLRAIERDHVDEQWLRSLPPAIPDNVLQALSRTGHQVQERRQLVPVPLQDGRRLLMPVDQVEVHYVGNPTY